MHAGTPESPIVFLKPSSAVIQDGGTVMIPSISSDLHHEVEMVVVIGKGGSQIPIDQAYRHVEGYAVGLDMTLRDVQAEAKKKGLPWSVAKGFDTSAPISTIVTRDRVPDAHNLTITLKVNGKERQHSNTREMIFRVDYLVSYLSSLFTLDPGDVIFTGTPEGVGRVVPGDLLEAELESVGMVRVGVGTHTTQ
jgi:5-carboxymethyl-2-hydroxymuconate isomerase